MRMRFVAVAVMVLFLLVGCGGGGGGSGPTAGNDTGPGNDTVVPQLLTASLGGSVNGVLSAFQGQNIDDSVIVVAEIERGELNFTLTNGPVGSSIGQDGVFHYAIPADMTPGVVVPVQIAVTHARTGQSITLDESIYVMERKVVAMATFGPTGGELSDEWGEIIVRIPAGVVQTQATVEIIRSRDANGNVVITVQSDEASNDLVEISFADPELLFLKEAGSVRQETPTAVQSRSVAALAASPGQESDTLVESWGLFWNPLYDPSRMLGLGNRVPNPSKVQIPLVGAHQFKSAISSRLTSYRDPSLLANKIPVLLIHGYTPSREGLGGGPDTWGNLPALIQSLNDNYSVFEFQWITAARFQDVATELGMAVNRLHKLTGKKVHIVAHSFGGILTRTLLQGMASKFPYPHTGGNIASLITVGTPHAGIFAVDETRNGKTFRNGQDSSLFLGVGQASCYQMGAYVPFVEKEKEVFQLTDRYGDFLGELSDLKKNSLPSDLPLRVLIGLTDTQVVREEGGVIIRGIHVLSSGDGLISFEGQRFHAGASDTDQLLTGDVSETVLRWGREVKPGDANPDNHVGYRHSITKAVLPLAAVPMVYVTSTEHDTFKEIKDWLATKDEGVVSPLPEPEFTLSTTVRDAVTISPIKGALILIKVNNSTVSKGVSDSNGQAIIQNIPFYANRTYTAIISTSGGYRPKSQTVFTLNTVLESPTSFGTVLLQPLTVTSISPKVAQSPMSGSAGTTFVQWGTGFTPNGTAVLHFRKPDGSEYPTQTVQLDSIGHFEVSYTVPADKPAGSYTWWAVDSVSGRSSNEITYQIITGNISPSITMKIVPPRHFMVSGNGFTPGGTVAFNYTFHDGTVKAMPLSSGGAATVFPNGEFFSHVYQVPIFGPGELTWWIVDNVTGKKSNEYKSSLFSATISQDKNSGVPGTVFPQYGENFTPNGTVTLQFRKPDGTMYPWQPQDTISLDFLGKFHVNYISPLDKALGTYTWWAIDDETGARSNELSYEIVEY